MALHVVFSYHSRLSIHSIRKEEEGEEEEQQQNEKEKEIEKEREEEKRRRYGSGGRTEGGRRGSNTPS